MIWPPTYSHLLIAASVTNATGADAFQRFTFLGPLTVISATGLGFILVVVCAMTLWLEARFSGKRWVQWFLPLRFVVLGTTLWMCLEPTQTTVMRRSERKTLAILTDISESMETVDASDPAKDLRWAIASRPADTIKLVSLCDRLQVSTTAAWRCLQQAQKLSESHRAFQALRERVYQALKAAENSQSLYSSILKSSEPLLLSEKSLIENNYASLRDEIIPSLQQLSQQPISGTSSHQIQSTMIQTLLTRLEYELKFDRKLAALALDRDLASGNSASFTAMEKPSSRRERVNAVLEGAESSWISRIERETRILRWAFDHRITLLADKDWKQSGNAVSETQADAPRTTNLSAALEHIGRTAPSERIEAVVLLSDGRQTDVTERSPQDAAASLGHIPFFVVVVGDDRLMRDIELHRIDAPRAVAKNDKIVIESLVTASDCVGETLQIELIARDALRNEEILERQQFIPQTLRADHPVSFTTTRSETGRYEYAVRVVPVADEVSENNNEESITVDVIEDIINVLLADNSPRWEFRFLSNLFERDPHIKHHQLIFHPTPAGTGELAESAQLPVELDGWSRYRVVILGDLLASQLPEASQRSLREYVSQRGGTVVLIAGPEGMPQAFSDTPLAELLPVVATSASERDAAYSVIPTAEGRMSSAVQVSDDLSTTDRVWNEAFQFNPLNWLSTYRVPKPSAHTLLRAVSLKNPEQQGKPEAFLCWQNLGRGKVAMISAPATYRLRARHGDRYHHAFWGQLLRWAMASDLAGGSKTVRITADKEHYESGEPVQITAQLHDTDGEPVRLAKIQAVARIKDTEIAKVDLEPDGKIPGRYLGHFDRLSDGQILIRPVGDDVKSLLGREGFQGEVTTTITVARNVNAETHDLRSDPALLARIAELTGGQLIHPTVLCDLPNLVSLAPRVIESESHQPMWNQWWCLWLISGCLILEWIVRKQTNLL